MATPPFPNAGNPIPSPDMIRLVEATQANTAATLAAALISASRRPHSVRQALDLTRDIQWSLHPVVGMGAYEAWKKSFDATKVHA